MSGHLYLINPTFICLIKHKQEHMEGDNRLRTDVMGCLTPSPHITKSLNQSLVPDQVFMPVLIKIIKPVDIGAQSHLQFPDDWWRLQFSFCSSPLLYPRICWSAHTHTHTHTCTCLHNIFTLAHNTIKNEILSSPMGVGVGKHKINPQFREGNYFSSVDTFDREHL
jgi:hypothetical protein